MTHLPQPTQGTLASKIKSGLASLIVGALALSALGFGIKTCAYYNWPRKIEYTEVVRTGSQTVMYDTSATDYLASSVDYDSYPAVYVLDSLGNEICIYGKSLEGIKEGTKLKYISYSPVINCECNDIHGLELLTEQETEKE
jgi:hypothetical protein